MRTTYLFVGIIVGFITGYIIIGNTGNINESAYIYTTDTLVVHDTVNIVTPQYISEKVIDSREFNVTPDSVSDTTVCVSIDVVSRHYSGELYDAYVSGVEPVLDSIHIYTPTTMLTRTLQVKPKRWHFGISAGAAATPRGLQPYVGIGVTYSLFAF